MLRILTYLSLGLLALAATLVLVLAVVILSFDDQNYQDVLVGVVNRFTDETLEINGDFHIERSLSPSVSVRDLVLDSRDGSHSIRVDKLVLKMKLGPLLRRRLVIDQLTIDGAVIDLVAEALRLDHANREENQARFIPVIKRADFRNITLKYREERNDSPRQLILDELALLDIYTGGPISINGKATFDDLTCQLEGKLGSVMAFYDDSQPWLVTGVIRSDALVLAVNGTITDPSAGKGLDLEFSGDINDLSAMLNRFDLEVPQLGKLSGKGSIYGDFTTPGVGDLQLALSRGSELTVSAEGDIPDLRSGKGMEIQLSGVIDDPQIIAWKLPEGWPAFDWLQFEGKARSDGREISIENLDAHGSTPDGLEESYRGSLSLDPRADGPVSDIDILIQLSAPNTAAAKITLGDGLPEMGAVSGQARMVGTGGHMSVEDLDLRFGSRDALWVTVAGRTKNSSFDPDIPDTGMDFDITIETKNTSQLATPLELTLPEIGPVSARFHFSGAKARSRLDKLVLRAGVAGELVIDASGSLSLGDLGAEQMSEMVEAIKIDAQLATRQTREVADLLDQELPELGPVQTKFSLAGRLTALAMTNGSLKLGGPDRLEISATGRIDRFSTEDPQALQGLNIDLQLVAPRTSDLAPLAGRPVPDLGPFKGSFGIKGSQKALAIENIKLAAGRAPDLLMTAEGGVEQILLQDPPVFNNMNVRLKMQADSLRRVPAFTDSKWSNLGPLSSNGRLTGRNSKIRYTGSATSGKTNTMVDLFLGLDGKRPAVSGKITVPVLHLTDMGIDLDHDGGMEKGKAKAGPVFGREPLDLDFLEAIEMALRIDVDEIKGTYYAVSEVHASIGLNDGHLKIKPLRLLYDKANVSMEAEVSKDPRPRLRLELLGKDLPAMAVWRHINKEVPLKGDFSLAIDLTSEGHSAHEIASNLNGEFGLMLENAEVASSDLNLLMLDMLGWAYRRSHRSKAQQKMAYIDCGVTSFNVNNGLATSETIYLDAPTMVMNGKGTVNFEDETMDLLLLPKQKKKMYSTTSPIIIKGPLTDPGIKAVPSATAAVDYGGIVFAPYIFIPKIALERMWKMHSEGNATEREGSKSAGCMKARGEFISSH